MNIPFSNWPKYTDIEAKKISEILLSGKVNYWTGKECRDFEKEFANWIGTKYAVSLMNGTVALDIALKAINIQPEDEVIVTPRSFIASVSCVVNNNAKPIFSDIDETSGNITAVHIKELITPRTKAIICVHLAGWPCDMDPIMELARENNIFVIEDCAQAHGAIYKGKKVGSIGHIGAWSFCQDKIMTTGGEGGMVTCNDEKLWNSMWSYKDHGKNYLRAFLENDNKGFRWLHDNFGTNYRMTEIQAAIGRIQLKYIKEWNIRRRKNAETFIKALSPFTGKNGIVITPGLNCSTCNANKELMLESSSSNYKSSDKCSCVHAFYKLYFYVRPENLKINWTRDRIIKEINNRGVPCYFGTCSEIYNENAFRGSSLRPRNPLPIAKKLGETSIVLLVHPSLTSVEIKKTKNVLTEVMTLASK